MAIFRGTGGSGESSSDSAISAVAASAVAAAASATAASSSATSAATSATNAATSASGASTSATSATSSASAASTSATNAATSATSASGSASTATTQASNASTSATNAASSASAASTSATNAATSASGASTSATTATTKASEASTSATNAASSASAASTSATNAASSASTASTAATTATTKASEASTSASNAATSATNAANSATTAASFTPSQTGNSGKYLTTDGTATSWGTINTGTVAIAGGGTGATTANAAMANLMGFTSTATAAGTTTLDNTSSYYQLFTGTTTQTVVLPVTSTLQTGWTFHICNNSSGTVTVQSSGLNTVISVIAGVTVMCTCIGTTLTTAADWEAGFTDFSTITGSGANVLGSSPTISFASLGSPTATGTLGLVGSTTSLSNFHTTQTSGVMTVGGTLGTGNIIVGRSTVSQQTDIQSGATASGSTKTINFGSGGLAGSTTAITIGSTAGTSTTTLNGTVSLANALVSSAGTAALPAITTTGDTNTGIYFPAADTIAFTEGGLEKMRIDSGGSVRINNTSNATFSAQLNTQFTSAFQCGQYLKVTDTSASQSMFIFGNSSSDAVGSIATSGAGTSYNTSATSGVIGVDASTIAINTASSERMRITSGGNVLVNTTSNIAAGAKIFAVGSGVGIAVGYGTGSSEYRHLYMNSGDGTLYFFNDTNYASLNPSGAWTNASDARLKKNIVDIKYGLSDVLKLQPRSYQMNSVAGDFVGFIAQELQGVIPEVVSGDPEKQLGVDYGSLVAVAFKAIQEQQALITALTARITALESN